MRLSYGQFCNAARPYVQAMFPGAGGYGFIRRGKRQGNRPANFQFVVRSSGGLVGRDVYVLEMPLADVDRVPQEYLRVLATEARIRSACR